MPGCGVPGRGVRRGCACRIPALGRRARGKRLDGVSFPRGLLLLLGFLFWVCMCALLFPRSLLLGCYGGCAYACGRRPCPGVVLGACGYVQVICLLLVSLESLRVTMLP